MSPRSPVDLDVTLDPSFPIVLVNFAGIVGRICGNDCLCRDRIGRLHWLARLRSTAFLRYLPGDHPNIHRGETE
jgi:hypothetical protein